MRAATAIISTFVTLTGCKPGLEASTPASAFGQLDAEFVPLGNWDAIGALLAVWHPEEGHPVVMGSQCSGVLLPGRLILTNAHCTPASGNPPGISLRWSNAYRAKSVEIEQIRSYEQNTTISFQGDLVYSEQDLPSWGLSSRPVFRSGAELDYQLYDIEDGQDLVAEVLPLDYGDSRSSGPSILVSHPKGMPLLQSGACTRKLQGDAYLHDCDSLKGSSGGAIIDPVTNVLLGLHSQGYSTNDPKVFAERGRFEEREELIAKECSQRSPPEREACFIDAKSKAYNRAIPLASILADLKARAPNLYARIRAEE